MPQDGEANSNEDGRPGMAYPVADERIANGHSLLKLPLFLAFNPGATCRMESRITLSVSRMRHCRVTYNHSCATQKWLNPGFDTVVECVCGRRGKDMKVSGRGLI
jgi:hypothetical protein